MSNDQEKILLSLTEALFTSLDDQMQLIYAKYADMLVNPNDIYQAFVSVLAQTLGRHIAAFPADERDQIALDALEIQEETTALVITETAKAELSKAQKKTAEVKYDLAKMKPEGNA